MSGKRIPLYVAWIFIALIIIACTIMGLIIWPQAEDINAYGCNPELLLPLGEPIPPFSELENNAIDSYLHDNGRFVNYNDILLTALSPRWFWALLNTIFLAGIFIYLWKISVIPSPDKKQSATIVTLMGILVLLIIPWSDYLFLQRYTTPYIWGGTMMLFTSYGCIRIATGHKYRRLIIFLFSIVAIICGGWHEGISIIMLCSLIPLWFMTPKERRRPYSTILICLLTGFCLNLTAPGFSNRVDSISPSLNPFNWFQPATLTGGVWLWPHIVPMIMYICIVIICITINHQKIILLIKDCRAKGWHYRMISMTAMQKIQTFSFTATLSTCGMCLFFNMPRVAIPGLLASIIGILSLAIKYYPQFNTKAFSNLAKVTVAICSLLLLANIGVNIAMQVRLSRDHQTIERMLAESPDGQVFYDPIEWPHKSHYPWQWTINHYYVNYVPLHFILIHPSNKRHLPLRLIPTALKNLHAAIPVKGITFVDSNIISDREPTYTSSDDNRRELIFPGEYPFLKINAVVETASGREEIRFFEIIPFTTGKGSSNERDLYYFRPVWHSHSEITDPAVKILSVSPAKYW